MSLAKHIPNIITSLNLISGAVAITFAFADNFNAALICIIIAAVFDFLDGFAARLLHAYSDVGKELDSLADTVSFGLAPSLIFYNFLKGFVTLDSYVKYIPLVMAAFAAYRLAKFNLDTRQTSNFLGLPVPAFALCTASLIALSCNYPLTVAPLFANNYVLPIIAIILSLLLISEVPMFSMKIKSLKWKENKERFIFIIVIIPIAILILAFGIHWTGIIFAIFSIYILWNLIAWIIRKCNRSNQQTA